MTYEPTEGLTVTWDTRRQAWPHYKQAMRRRLTDAPKRTWDLDGDYVTHEEHAVFVWAKRWGRYPEAHTMPDRLQGLLFTGPPGTGKTVVASRAANLVSDAGYTAKFITAPDYHQAMLHVSDMRRDNDPDVMAYEETVSGYGKWKAWRLLVLDDLGRERNTASEYSQSLMEELLRSRYDDDAPTIVTTNLTVPQIGKRYGSRMESLIHELFWVIEVNDEKRKRG